jgi:AcrR family transcriptional regulator
VTTFRQHAEEQILDSAAGLLARRGARTSLQEIADAVGLSKAGLQHHFPTKDALHTAVAAKTAELGQQVLALVADLPVGAERDRRAIEAWVDVALAHPGLVSLLLAPATTAEVAPADIDAVHTSGTVALAAFGVDPTAPADERTVRVAAALAALAVLTVTAHQQDLTVAWRPHIVLACFDALGHSRPFPTSEA